MGLNCFPGLLLVGGILMYLATALISNSLWIALFACLPQGCTICNLYERQTPGCCTRSSALQLLLKPSLSRCCLPPPGALDTGFVC